MKTTTELTASQINDINNHFNEYGFPNAALNIIDFTPLEGGLNRGTFLVSRAEGFFVVSVFDTKRENSPESVTHLQQFLNYRGVKVPAPVGHIGQFQDNAASFQVSEFVRSAKDQSINRSRMCNGMRELGKFHREAQSFPTTLMQPEHQEAKFSYMKRLFDRGLHIIEHARVYVGGQLSRADKGEALMMFRGMAASTLTIISNKLSRKILPSGLIHGDAGCSNTLYSDEDEVAAIIDLESVRFAPYLHDISRFLCSELEAAEFDIEIFMEDIKAGLKVYNEERRLESIEIQEFPTLMKEHIRRNLIITNSAELVSTTESHHRVKQIDKALDKIDFFELLGVEQHEPERALEGTVR